MTIQQYCEAKVPEMSLQDICELEALAEDNGIDADSPDLHALDALIEDMGFHPGEIINPDEDFSVSDEPSEDDF